MVVTFDYNLNHNRYYFFSMTRTIASRRMDILDLDLTLRELILMHLNENVLNYTEPIECLKDVKPRTLMLDGVLPLIEELLRTF